MKAEKQAAKITENIKQIVADNAVIATTYRIGDDSVQAELRLSASWKIWARSDIINYPRDLSGQNADLWRQMGGLSYEIAKIAELKTGSDLCHIAINAKTKTGPEKRAEAKSAWIVKAGKEFLADYRAVTTKKYLAGIRKQITALQAQQKALLPKLRESNSTYLLGKKSAKSEQATKNAEALKSGRFWEADKDTLKGYFHPPFGKNYLADVSETWRAALFIECESVSYKRYSGDWGHKLAGTGVGYLCGIDDNGDEWGHPCYIRQPSDNFGDRRLEGSVDLAMSNLFGISVADLVKCQRQGDLLFCPASIPTETALNTQEQWEPRESHSLASPGMQRNGTYFKSAEEIIVSHTSHPTVTLPPGEYRLYMTRIADAD